MKKIFLMIASSVALVGCTVTPNKLSLTESVNEGLTSQANLVDGRNTAQANIALEEAIARALTYNRERRVSLMESVLTSTQMDVAKFDMLPELAANAGYSKRNNLGASSSGTYENGAVTRSTPPTYSVSSEKESDTQNVTLSWNLLDFGLSYVRAEQAADRLLISQERERKAIHNLIQDVRESYWRALSAQRLLVKVGPLYKRVDQALENAREIEASRLEDPVVALSYQRDLLDIRRSLEAVQQDLISAKSSLATLMGMAPNETFTLNDPQNFVVPDVKMDLGTLEKTALALRPELMEVRYQKRISYKEGRAALMGLLPSLNITGGYYKDSNGYLLNDEWESVGATLGFNLFNVFKAPTMSQLAENQKSLAIERDLAMTATVLGQVHISVVDYEQAKKRFETASDYYEVIKAIRLQMMSLKQTDQAGELDLIREEFSELLAELRRDVAYGDLQNSYGRIHVAAGLDPIPTQVADDSVETLASAISQQLTQWEKGQIALVSNPIAGQLEGPWQGAGEHRFTFAEDTFALGGQITYQATLSDGSALPSWFSFDPVTRTFSGNPPASVDHLSVEVTAENEHQVNAKDRFKLHFSEPNDAPIFEQISAIQAGEDDAVLTGQIVAKDADLDALTVMANSDLPSGFKLEADGNWSYQAAQEQWQSLNLTDEAVERVSVKVVDTLGATAYGQTDLIVRGKNDTPIMAENDPVTLRAGKIASGQLMATDVDRASRLTFSGQQADGLTVSDSGAWRFEADASTYRSLAEGQTQSLTFEMAVTDEHGASSKGELAVTVVGVNDAPTADMSQSVTIALTAENNYRALLPKLDFVDPDGDALNYALKRVGFFGLRSLPKGIAYDPAMRAVSASVSPTEQSQEMDYRLVVVASDAQGLTASLPLTLTVRVPAQAEPVEQ